VKDNIVENFIKREVQRQAETLNLIPSENIASAAVMKALGSPLTNKYSEGYPGKRYYGGNEIIDQIEVIAQERARKVFHLGKNWHVNVQPYSGSPANLAVYFALLNPGDTVLGMSLPFGGHLTHGWKVNFSGRLYRGVQYTVGRDGFLDYDEVRKLARKERPKMIIAGATAYPRIIDFKKFGAIAKEAGSYFLADISHISGLIAAGVHPSPFPYADVVMTTTHKTMRGPRGALLFANRNSVVGKKNNLDIGTAIDKAIFPGLQGGPHDHQTAAIAIGLFEALSPAFKKYGHQIVKNAKALAHELIKLGFSLVSGGTDNHLLLIDLTSLGISGWEGQERLERSGIIVNRNTIPYDTRSPFDPSGIRLGTPALTSRGMKEKEMKKIAGFMADALIKNKNAKTQVRKLCLAFPPYKR